jgi:hypothetical protein
VHNARHSIRGSEGLRRRQKWGEFWKQAMGLATRWLECGLCRSWAGYYTLDFKATRRIFLNELKHQVQADAGEIIRDSHPVVDAVCPPCEMENIVAYLKKTFTQQQVLAADAAELDHEDSGVEPTDDASARSSHEPAEQRVDAVIKITNKQPAHGKKARYDDEMTSKDVARHSWDGGHGNADKFELPPSDPQDQLATRHGKPCSHYQRELPAIGHQASKTNKPRLVQGSPLVMYFLAKNILEAWLSKRLGLDQVLDRPTEQPYPWSPDPDQPLHPDLHSTGKWFWCGVHNNNWVPPPPNGTDCESRTLHGQRFETFIHTSNMYIVHRAMIGGLEPGKDPGKGGKIGVYAYRPIGNRSAMASSGYAVYSDLAKNGLYFSPRFQLEVNTSKAIHDGVKMSVGDQQYALPVDYYHITGMWFHCLSGDDIMAGKSRGWTPLDDWHPEYELRSPHAADRPPIVHFQ